MPAPLEAVLVHSMPGRLRLRLVRPRHPGIEPLAAELSRRHGVLKVAFRVETGSLLVLHDGRFRPEADPALRLLTPRSAPAGPSSARSGRAGVAQAARPQLGGIAGAAAFSGLALLQVARGRVLPPAVTLLWYAAALLGGGGRKSGG